MRTQYQKISKDVHFQYKTNTSSSNNNNIDNTTSNWFRTVVFGQGYKTHQHDTENSVRPPRSLLFPSTQGSMENYGVSNSMVHCICDRGLLYFIASGKGSMCALISACGIVGSLVDLFCLWWYRLLSHKRLPYRQSWHHGWEFRWRCCAHCWNC